MSVKPRAQFTLEFKLKAVRLVKASQSDAVTAKVLGIVKQKFYNGIKLNHEGQLTSAGSKLVSPEQMEIARL